MTATPAEPASRRIWRITTTRDGAPVSAYTLDVNEAAHIRDRLRSSGRDAAVSSAMAAVFTFRPEDDAVIDLLRNLPEGETHEVFR
jgi:hypothetical protein